MEEVPVIPGLVEAVFKEYEIPHTEYEAVWQSVRILLVKHLKKESVAYKQLMSIPSDQNLLIECCSEGYIELMSVFIKNSLPINCGISYPSPGPRGSIETMLHFAARNFQLPLIKYLVSCGADVNADSFSGTPLNGALSCKKTVPKNIRTDVVKILLEAGSQVDDIVTLGQSSLCYAMKEDNIESAKLLIKYGACINGKGDTFLFETPLYWAVRKQSVRCVKLLLEEGADVNLANDDGETALSCAVTHENSEIIILLLNSGADLSLRYSGGNTILHIAMKYVYQKEMELLLERSSNVDSKNDNNDTPLFKYVFQTNNIRYYTYGHFVSENGINKVGMLVIWGANINTTDANGRTLLHWAAWQGSIHLVKLLIDRGLDVKDKFGKKPIHYARDAGHDNVVQFFMDYYCDKFIV